MCGIAGILSPGPPPTDLRPALRSMQASLRHRGPDGEGEWAAPGGGALFAHTRLAVFDPSPAGHQPMSIEGGRFVITYSGAIYNFAEIRRALERAGVQFTTSTDTEVILRLYERDGPVGISRLRGMFAFALWDAEARTCVLARDRFGIKPLYYSLDHGRLIFASEVRALLASALVPVDLDPAGVYGLFRTGSVPEPLTIARNIRCVPAAHSVHWCDGRMSARRYWQLQFPADGAGAAAADVRHALADSVEHHFAGDASVGLLLSGGVDSTAILALAHAGGRTGVETFSLTLPGEPDDEGPLARRTAGHFGAIHHECVMDAASARAAFLAYKAAVDQPTTDGLNAFVMARFAREHGIKVLLSGVGADELFGGYPSFRGVPRLAAWHQRFHWTGALASQAGRLAAAAARGSRSRRVADMLSRAPSLENAYQAYRGIFTHAESVTLAAHYAGVPAEPFALPPTDEPDDVVPADAVSRLELTRYARNQLLRDADVMAMAWGVEVRTPFLDAPLVDRLSRVPAPVRLAPGKALLRAAVPEWPAWVDPRTKRGFHLPFERWIDGEWREVLASGDRGCPVATGTWYRQWCVSALESWMAVNRAAHA
jgi:asparagine synthase (glutamine-hydrolysing)